MKNVMGSRALEQKPEVFLKSYLIDSGEYFDLKYLGICSLEKVGDIQMGELLELTYEEDVVLAYVFSIESQNELEKSANFTVYVVGRKEDHSDLMKEKKAMLQRLALPTQAGGPKLSLSDRARFSDRESTVEYLRKSLFFATEDAIEKVADRILRAQQQEIAGTDVLYLVEKLITMWRLDATRILLTYPRRGFPFGDDAFATQGDFYDLCQKIPLVSYYF